MTPIPRVNTGDYLSQDFAFALRLADIDFDCGDKLSADTWRDIASAAARIVGAKAAA
jgi:hypothetical protein